MRRFVGDKGFYKYVFALVIPIMIQQGITSFVNLLDNVMVGALGTEAISAVSISNQLFFNCQLAVFGGLSAVAIFGAQFYGNKDMEGMRYSFRVKFLFSIIITALTVIILLSAGDFFIQLFLQGESGGGDMALTAESAGRYLRVMLVGFFPFVLSQSYAGTLRETGQTVWPMAASVAGILTNLCLNWLLIYGHLGFPKWGVFGAAVATVAARYLEMVILILYTHRNLEKYPFMKGAYRSMRVPLSLTKRILRTGAPLFANEFLWAFGITSTSQSFSTFGLEAVAATSIVNTVWSLFMIVMVAMGSAVQIIVGQHLGMGQIKEAREIDAKLIFLDLVLNIGLSVILISCSGAIPRLFNVGDSVRSLASQLMVVDGLVLPIEAVVHVIYFTIRSGGRTVITFLFDSVYQWCIPVPLAFFLSRYSSLPLLTIYALVMFSAVIKMIIGLIMLRSDFWARKIV